MALQACCLVSQELLLKLVEDHYPLPPDPDQQAVANGKSGGAKKAAVGGRGKRRKAEAGQEAAKGKKRAKQKAGGNCNGNSMGDSSLEDDGQLLRFRPSNSPAVFSNVEVGSARCIIIGLPIGTILGSQIRAPTFSSFEAGTCTYINATLASTPEVP